MTKANVRKLRKLIVKIYTIILTGLVIIGVANNLSFIDSEKGEKFLMRLGVCVTGIVLIFVGIIYLVYFVEKVYFKKNTDYIEREIPKEIPPAIASILLDLYIDEEQDYLSTVSSLISKGYVEIVNNKEIIIKNNNTSGLLEHEILAFDILAKRKFYDSEKFKNIAIRDAKKMGLIVRTNRFIKMWKYIGKCILDTIFLMTISLIGVACIGTLENYGAVRYMFWVILAIYAYKLLDDAYKVNSYYSPTKEQSLKYIYEKTAKGEEYAEKIAGLKLFFKEYTLMDEKELESIIIYKDYIPYAIALGEADAIAKFIEENEDCRKLIYRV